MQIKEENLRDGHSGEMHHETDRERGGKESSDKKGVKETSRGEESACDGSTEVRRAQSFAFITALLPYLSSNVKEAQNLWLCCEQHKTHTRMVILFYVVLRFQAGSSSSPSPTPGAELPPPAEKEPPTSSKRTKFRPPPLKKTSELLDKYVWQHDDRECDNFFES